MCWTALCVGHRVMLGGQMLGRSREQCKSLPCKTEERAPDSSVESVMEVQTSSYEMCDGGHTAQRRRLMNPMNSRSCRPSEASERQITTNRRGKASPSTGRR